MAASIHLIERLGNMKCLDKETSLWESGWWHVSTEIAQKLIGGNIFFHKAQDKPSYFGGTITKYRLETEGEWTGRILFSFAATMEFKGITTSRNGWGMEKKLVDIP
jgi:hypothetical protein